LKLYQTLEVYSSLLLRVLQSFPSFSKPPIFLINSNRGTEWRTFHSHSELLFLFLSLRIDNHTRWRTTQMACTSLRSAAVSQRIGNFTSPSESLFTSLLRRLLIQIAVTASNHGSSFEEFHYIPKNQLESSPSASKTLLLSPIKTIHQSQLSKERVSMSPLPRVGSYGMIPLGKRELSPLSTIQSRVKLMTQVKLTDSRRTRLLSNSALASSGNEGSERRTSST